MSSKNNQDTLFWELRRKNDKNIWWGQSSPYVSIVCCIMHANVGQKVPSR